MLLVINRSLLVFTNWSLPISPSLLTRIQFPIFFSFSLVSINWKRLNSKIIFRQHHHMSPSTPDKPVVLWPPMGELPFFWVTHTIRISSTSFGFTWLKFLERWTSSTIPALRGWGPPEVKHPASSDDQIRIIRTYQFIFFHIFYRHIYPHISCSLHNWSDFNHWKRFRRSPSHVRHCVSCKSNSSTRRTREIWELQIDFMHTGQYPMDRVIIWICVEFAVWLV